MENKKYSLEKKYFSQAIILYCNLNIGRIHDFLEKKLKNKLLLPISSHFFPLSEVFHLIHKGGEYVQGSLDRSRGGHVYACYFQ